MPIIEAIAASNVEAVHRDKPSNDEALSEAIAASDKPKSKAKRSRKSDADKRFTADEAAAYYSAQSGKPLSASSLRTNAKKYGFMIKEKGSGLYALIDS